MKGVAGAISFVYRLPGRVLSVPSAGSPGGPLALRWGVVSLCLSAALHNALLALALAFTWEVKANSRAFNSQFKTSFLCWQRQKYKVGSPGRAAPASSTAPRPPPTVTLRAGAWLLGARCSLSPLPCPGLI